MVYMANNPEQPEKPWVIPEFVRNTAYNDDIARSRKNPELQNGNRDAQEVAEGLIREVEYILEDEKGELYSRAERDALLAKLDAAIAIANEPYAQTLRKQLIERFP